MRTIYRTTLRPALFGGVPFNLQWEWHRPPAEYAHVFPDKEVSEYPYGEFTTERPLTETELQQFSIEVVGTE